MDQFEVLNTPSSKSQVMFSQSYERSPYSLNHGTKEAIQVLEGIARKMVHEDSYEMFRAVRSLVGWTALLGECYAFSNDPVVQKGYFNQVRGIYKQVEEKVREWSSDYSI